MASIFRLGGVIAVKNINCSAAWRPTQSLLRNIQCRVLSCSAVSLSASPQQPPQLIPDEGYWEKNKRLSRPISPHLSIYKPQVTWVMSLFHRTTGIILSAFLSAFGIGMLILPASYPYYIGLLSDAHYGAGLIFAAKFLLALPFSYHTLNGVRHLTWDMGYGFSLRALYKSGYGVVALSVLTALALASY